MHLDLMDVLRAPGTSQTREISISPDELEEAGVSSLVRGVVRASNGRSNIVVTGAASADVELQCSRCLESFSEPMEFEIEAVAPMVLFAEHVGGDTDDDEEDARRDPELLAIFHGHSADVTEMVRQAIELNRPIAPLCSPDCAGLPEASSFADAPDPRWDALRRAANSNGEAKSTI